MINNNLLLIIDPQNDFCQPTGALYVPGAEYDMQRLARLISHDYLTVKEIIVSLDNHHVINVSHPSYWRAGVEVDRQQDGVYPQPFTSITYSEVCEGKWIPRFESQKAMLYLKQLEEQGEFPHIIWPEHCIIGSIGAAITDVLLTELKNWERKRGIPYQVVSKGMCPQTEMFGIFRANIPDPCDQSTAENVALINKLALFDTIYVAGEAKSHCVANSIKQLFGYPDIIKKLVVLEDCMSNVAGFDTIATPIYQQASQMGAQFAKSVDFN